jgi:hypothetical protein
MTCLTRSQTAKILNMSLIRYHSILLSTVSHYPHYGSAMSIGCCTGHCRKSIFARFSRKRANIKFLKVSKCFAVPGICPKRYAHEV